MMWILDVFLLLCGLWMGWDGGREIIDPEKRRGSVGWSWTVLICGAIIAGTSLSSLLS